MLMATPRATSKTSIPVCDVEAWLDKHPHKREKPNGRKLPFARVSFSNEKRSETKKERLKKLIKKDFAKDGVCYYENYKDEYNKQMWLSLGSDMGCEKIKKTGGTIIALKNPSVN